MDKIIKIVQLGCSGSLNYGDEVSHINVRKMIRNLFSNTHFTMIGHKSFILKHHHDDSDDYCQFVDIDRCNDLITNCDFWIYGPGTMVPWEKENIFKFFELNPNVIIWGVGCGTDIMNPRVKIALKNALYVTCRDTKSFERLLKVRQSTKLIPDPMFASSSLNGKRKLHGITVASILELDKTLTDDQKNNIYDILSNVMTTIGGEWIAIPASLCKNIPKGDYSDNDNKCHIKLKKKFPQLQIMEVSNFKEITELLTNIDLYITSRLHTGVVTVGSKIPTVYFGSEKIKWMCDGWDRSNLYTNTCDKLTENQIISSYHYALENTNIDHIIKNIPMSIELMKNVINKFINKDYIFNDVVQKNRPIFFKLYGNIINNVLDNNYIFVFSSKESKYLYSDGFNYEYFINNNVDIFIKYNNETDIDNMFLKYYSGEKHINTDFRITKEFTKFVIQDNYLINEKSRIGIYLKNNIFPNENIIIEVYFK